MRLCKIMDEDIPDAEKELRLTFAWDERGVLEEGRCAEDTTG